MAQTIRTDTSAYKILNKYRKKLIKTGQQGASFSDTIRFMETIIQRIPN